METFSNRAFCWALIAAFGAALAACGDDLGMMESPFGTSGTGAGMVGGSAGTPAAAGGGAGPAAAGSSAVPGAAGAPSGVAGGAAAGTGAAGVVAMPAAGAAAGAGVAGSGTAGTPAAGAGAGGASGSVAAAGGGGSAAGGGGSAAGAGGSAAGAGGSGAAAATFTEVYGLIMAGCSCHVTGNAGGLGMGDKSTAYTNLVGANSGACTGQKRVVAGSPETSVLFHSVDRTNLGNCMVPRMPAGGPKWSDADIQIIRSWIMAGAMND